jgi:hypothetical protein
MPHEETFHSVSKLEKKKYCALSYDGYIKKGWGHLKIFCSRTNGPEKLKFTQKLSGIIKLQDC